MSEHTKEPWVIRANEFDRKIMIMSEVDSDGFDWDIARVYNCPHENADENVEANAKRIVTCVNLCAGLTETQIKEALDEYKGKV